MCKKYMNEKYVSCNIVALFIIWRVYQNFSALIFCLIMSCSLGETSFNTLLKYVIHLLIYFSVFLFLFQHF